MTDQRIWASPGSPLPEETVTPAPGDPAVAAPGHEATDARPAEESGRNGADAARRFRAGESDKPEEPEEADNGRFDADVPLRPLSVAEILDAVITSIRHNPRAVLGLSVIPTAVVQVIVTIAQYYVLGKRARSDLTPSVILASIGSGFMITSVALLLTSFVVLVLAGLLSPVIARTLLGRPTSFRRAWRSARPSLGRLLRAATLIFVVTLLALAIPIAPLIAAVAGGAPDGLQAVAAVVGAPLSVAAMVTVYVWIALATPILVLERRGVIAALRRSVEIVRGRWWRTFGVLALALVITLFVEFVAIPIPFAIAQQLILASTDQPGRWLTVTIVAVGGVGRIVAGSLVNPFNAGVIALLYADRRMRREALDLELRTRPPRPPGSPAEDPLDAWLPGPLTAAGAGRQPKVPNRPPTAFPPSSGWPR